MRITTDIKSNNEFFSDLNGFQVGMTRILMGCVSAIIAPSDLTLEHYNQIWIVLLINYLCLLSNLYIYYFYTYLLSNYIIIYD